VKVVQGEAHKRDVAENGAYEEEGLGDGEILEEGGVEGHHKQVNGGEDDEGVGHHEAPVDLVHREDHEVEIGVVLGEVSSAPDQLERGGGQPAKGEVVKPDKHDVENQEEAHGGHATSKEGIGQELGGLDTTCGLSQQQQHQGRAEKEDHPQRQNNSSCSLVLEHHWDGDIAQMGSGKYIRHHATGGGGDRGAVSAGKGRKTKEERQDLLKVIDTREQGGKGVEDPKGLNGHSRGIGDDQDEVCHPS